MSSSFLVFFFGLVGVDGVVGNGDGVAIGLVLVSFDHWKASRMRRRRVDVGFGFETSTSRRFCARNGRHAATTHALRTQNRPGVGAAEGGSKRNRPMIKRKTKIKKNKTRTDNYKTRTDQNNDS